MVVRNYRARENEAVTAMLGIVLKNDGSDTEESRQEKISEVDEVCACGPTPMLKAIADVCKEAGKPCQISLEERMACGMGACLVCAVKVRKNGEEIMQHVCKNGPVFNAEEVVFNG